MNLIGTGEIEKRHRLSRVQVWRLIQAKDWPEPVSTVGKSRVWHVRDVDQAVERLLSEGRLVDVSNGTKRIVPRPFVRGTV